MKVTQVERQKKDSKRFNVYLDGNFAFGADEDLIVNFRLVVGKDIPADQLEKLLFEAEAGKILDRIYGLLSIRGRSEKEIRDYLRTLSFKRKLKDRDEISEAVVDSVVERLKTKGLIDDNKFARDWVESKVRSKGLGKSALKSELYKKGIDRNIIEEVLSEDLGESETDLAIRALSKKVDSWKALGENEFNKKVYGYLGRRGFSFEVIKAAIASVKDLS